MDITRLTEARARADLDRFCALLADAVDHGAGVGFLRPLDPARARAYWNDVFAAVGHGSKILLAAADGGDLIGTVHLELVAKQNQPHRGEVLKLLVHTAHRRRGIARELMAAVEREAKAAGRWLLVLDTEGGSGAEAFYDASGWQRVGSIPSFALNADGVPTPNIIYYKMI